MSDKIDEQNIAMEGREQQTEVSPEAAAVELMSSPEALPGDNAQSRKLRPLTIVTCLLLALTVIIVLLKAWITSTPVSVQAEVDLAYRIGRLVGSILFPGVVTYLVWRFGCKRKMGKGMLIFSVLILVLAVGSLVNSLQDLEHRKAFVADMETVLRRLVNGDAVEYQRADQERYGQYSTIMDQLIDFIERQKKLSEELGNDLEQMLLGSIFTPESLATVESITLAQQKLEQLDQLYDRYIDTYIQRGEEYAAFASELKIPRSFEHYFSIFQLGVEEGVQGTVQMIGYEKETTAASRQFLEFLKARTGQFEFRDGTFVFQKAEDHEVFKAYVAELKRIQGDQMKKLESMQYMATPQQ